MAHTFQQPHKPAPAAREYILIIPDTQMPASQAIQTAQQSQMATKGQLVVDDQQAEPSRPLNFTLTPTKQFNPPSIASATGEECQHIRTRRLLWQSSICDELPTNRHTPAIFTTRPTTTSHLPSNHLHAAISAANPASASSAVSTAVEPLHLLLIGHFQDHCCTIFKGSFQDHLNLPEIINSCWLKKK